jgi:SpoVK/Ycf46/Vps4 family AAA+-type ATPase
MITEEGWLELVEVLLPPTNSRNNASNLSFPSAICREDSAIHIFFSRNDGNIPLTSVVLQSSISPDFISKEEKDNDNGNVEDKGNYESSRSILLRLHPVLFMFLYHASRTNNMMASEIQANESRNDEQSSSSLIIPTASDGRDLDFRVQLGPLPMPEFQFVQAMAQQQQQESEQQSFWKCRPVKVGKLKKGSEIFVSCVYVEEDDQWLSGKINDDDTSRINDKSQMPVDQVIGTSLEGRIIKAGAVLLLSTMYGYVVATITNIIENDKEFIGNLVSVGNQRDDATYRLSDDVLGDYHCHIKTPIFSHENNRNQFQVDNEATKWEREIPGYEAPLEEIIEIFRLHGDAAAASGVVVTGCAGVGKSRLASCVACHYSETGSFNKHDQQEASEAPRNISSLNQKIYYSSVQDLIFQASVETNLLENVLVPKLRGCILWVIDDLNLLENEAGDGDEVRNNAEIVMVQNALVEAMDRFHIKCCILGIAQSDTNLPSEFTKSGRLEKTLQMLPPTQLQRMKIWKYILARDTNGRSFLNNSASLNDDWIVTLASSTAGCVPRDLLRIYRDAHYKVQARNTQSCESPSVLEWEDLKEAIKSTIPSQLSELDVVRPTIFDEGVSWKEIHLRSWQNFGGYPLLKKSVYRQVVVPWRYFLQSLDESLSEEIIKNEKTWLEPPPGILFHGISGTGKTVAAKCLAVSLGLPIIQVRATDLLDKWLGGSESLLRSLFTRARTVSPCILFLDEIDAIACNREEDDNNDVSSRILSTLLNEMDGVSSAIRKSRVLVIACTNRIRSIDSALLRPGRLQEHFHLVNPSVSDLEEILRLRMSRIPVDQNLVLLELASKLFDIEATGADVEGLCREATFVAMRRVELHEDSDVAVSLKDFESAIAERFGASQYVHQ